MTAEPTHAPETMLAHALHYLADEWSVFPVCTPVPGKKDRCLQGHQGSSRCRSPGKEPLIKWGKYQDQLPTPAEVRGWWQRWPAANIGVATGELSDVVVVDLDGDLAIAEANRRGYEPGPWVRTGRIGGRHLYFRYRPDAPTIFSKISGIDFRGQGGYACLPPSLHHGGARYRWGEAYQRGEPLPDLPRWIDELARTNEGGGPRNHVDFGKLLSDGLAEGQRDQELFRAAAKLRGADVPYDVAVRLIQWAADACKPPFDLDEARAKVDSAYGRYTPNIVEVLNGHHEWTGAELSIARFDPPRWAIPGVLPSGLTILAGRPKLGKSWLALGWALDIARGSPVLGKILSTPGDTLYLALEDGPRRMQERMALMLGDAPWPAGITIVTEWPRLDDGGMAALEQRLLDNPNIRLVVVDTFKRIRPIEKGVQRLYDLDYDAIAPMAALARRHNVALVVVFHTRKGVSDDPLEMVSGTLGLSGAADGVIVLRRERGQADASLFITGRDVEEQDLALKWEKEDVLAWTLLGNAEQFRITQERQTILDSVDTMPGMSPAEIADATGRPRGAVRRLLFNMVRDGEIRVRDSRYYTIGNSGNTPNTPPIQSQKAVTAAFKTVAGGEHPSVSGNRTLAQDSTTVTAVRPVTAVTAVRPVTARAQKCRWCGRPKDAHPANDPVGCKWEVDEND